MPGERQSDLAKRAVPDCQECGGRGVVLWQGKIPTRCNCVRPPATLPLSGARPRLDVDRDNARVQDWLSDWAARYLPAGHPDWDIIESAIELIQGTYNPESAA